MNDFLNKRGILAVVSGFSGAGKGTVMKRLMEKYSGYALSVSVTTRSPRENEEEGVHYFFRSREEFEQLIEEDALIEYAEYQGNYYGTPRKYVEESLEQGQDVILEIEMQGAKKVKAKHPDAVLIFITPETFDQLRKRLVNRGTETEEQIAGRLKRAAEEAVCMKDYDYLAMNLDGAVEECVDRVHQILQCEHTRTSRNTEFMEKIRTEAGKGAE